MKNTIKSHPLMIFTFLKPVLFLALLPSVRTLIQIVFFKTVGGFRFLEAVFFILVSVLAELRRRSLVLSLFNDYLVFKKGLYFKSEFKTNREKIVSLYIRKNPIEKLFGVKTVFINVFCDKKSDYTFKITTKDIYAEKIIGYMGEDAVLEQKPFSFFKVAVFSIATSSTIEGLLIFVPSLNKMLNFFGLGLYDAVFGKVIEKTHFTDQYLPQMINTITLALVFIYLFGFFYQFFKNINYRLLKKENHLIIKSGFITKRESIVNRRDIRAIVGEQTLLLRVFRCFILKAATGGYTGRFLANGVIEPFLSRKELKNEAKKLCKKSFTEKEYIKKIKAPLGLVSVIMLPLAMFLTTLLGFIVAFIKFYNFRRVLVLLFILAGIVLFFYSETLIYGYNKGKMVLGDVIWLLGTNKLRVKYFFAKRENIGEIKIKENPFDRKRGSAKVLVSAFSKNPSAVTVRWINKSDFIENLFKGV